MPRTIIYDTDTRAILVLDPQLDDAGQPILPMGVNAAAATLPDTEAAKLSTANARFSLGADSASVVVTQVPPPPPDPALQQRLADAVTMLNAAAVMADQPTRDAFARQIGLQPLSIPITQKATTADIKPLA